MDVPEVVMRDVRPKTPKKEPHQLHGPDSYHVYIGYLHNSDRDEKIYQQLWKQFSNSGVTSYTDDSVVARCDNIMEGIKHSRKILLVVTLERMNEAATDYTMAQYEKQECLAKADYRGTGSLVILLCGVTEEELEPTLRGYPTYKSDDVGCQDIIQYLAEDYLPNPRNNDKMNMGFTLACSYIYGYLVCIMPELEKRIKDSKLMTLPNSTEVIMSTKLFVILPESCKCPTEISAIDPDFETCKSIAFNASHSGITNRDYKSVVSEFTDQKKKYRAVFEFPATLTVLWDMARDTEQILSMTDVAREMQLFYFNLKGFFNQPAFHYLRNRIRLIYFKDGRDNFGDLVKSAVKEEITAERYLVRREEGTALPRRISASFLPQENNHLKVTHEKNVMPFYQLANKNRGKAYIINNKEFTNNLENRPGSETDQVRMKKLFEWLGFDVIEKNDQTASEIKNLSVRLSVENYTRDQAIIICLMSHGILGQVYGTDGEPVHIMDITNKLKTNKTLLRKPKIFFIQSCQTVYKESDGESTDSNSEEEEEEEASMTNDINVDPVEQPESLNGSNLNDDAQENGAPTAENSTSENIDISSQVVRLHLGDGDHLFNGSGDGINNIDDPDVMNNQHTPGTATPSGCDVATCLQLDSNEPCERSSRADLVPSAPDFIMSYATLPESLSYRHTELGSIYIKELDKNIREERRSLPLDRILMKVSESVKKYMEKMFPEKTFDQRQLPFYVQTTEQLIYL